MSKKTLKEVSTPEERLEYLTTKWSAALEALADSATPKGIPPLRIRKASGGFVPEEGASRACFYFKSVDDMKASTDFLPVDVGKICVALDVWREVEYMVTRVYKDGTADLRPLGRNL